MNTSAEQNALSYNDTFSKLGDLWSPYKSLQRVVEQFLNNDDKTTGYYAADLEKHLRMFKQSFTSLLHNPPKNARSREELRKGMEDGIALRGIGQQVLSREIYQEATIISDMYDMNEYVALDFLCTAQIQMPYYPNLSRGLVAILLYYDGRKTIVSILRMLVQARRGMQWSLNITPEVEDLVTSFTDDLLANGLIKRILDLLKQLDLSSEIELLQKNVALGNSKHRKQVIDLFNSIRYCLADIVFLWSTNSGLPRDVTVALIQHVRELKPETESSSGTVDVVTVYLQMALLSTFDLSVLHSREDGDAVVSALPILTDSGFVETLHREINQSDSQWASTGLHALTKFSFAVTLAAMKLIPQGQHLHNLTEHEDVLVDTAIIDLRLFDFLQHVFLDCEHLYSEEFIYKKLHYLFTDFIILMFSKVKELRMKADENARMIVQYQQAGIEAPTNLSRNFEQFLTVLAKFYGSDPLKLDLIAEFWPSGGGVAIGNPSSITAMGSKQKSARSVALQKFIRLCGDAVPSSLFVPYLSLLRSVSNSTTAARKCFNLLKQNGQIVGETISWDHFFVSFQQYYQNLRQEAPPVHDTVYRRVAGQAGGQYHKGITPQEVDGLHAVLALIAQIAAHDDFSRLAFCEHPGWAPLSIFLGLVSCSVPTVLKAELLNALAALARSAETAVQTWANLEESQILVTVPTTSTFQPRGLQTELDEIESRNEEYPLTRALLRLFDVLTDAGIPRTLGAGPRRPGFDPYLTFIIHSVFLKYHTRSYKNPLERWQVAEACLSLFHKFLRQYEPDAADFPTPGKQSPFNSPPGFHVMVQLNTKSEFLLLLLFMLEDGVQMNAQYVSMPGFDLLHKCTELVLQILLSALALHNRFYAAMTATTSAILVTPLSKLLMSLNPRSGQPDFCLLIARYVCFHSEIPRQSLLAVKILTELTALPLIHTQLMNILATSATRATDIRDGFVECLDDREAVETVDGDLKKAIFELMKQCLVSYDAPSLAHFLFGYDLANVTRTTFQLAGVLNFPRTCIHALFLLLQHGLKERGLVSDAIQEAAYNVLYLLAANALTSEPTLRLLRMYTNFFRDHLTHCCKNMNASVENLSKASWFLKTVAIELRNSCTNKQLSQAKYLAQLLVGASFLPEKYVDEFSLSAPISIELEPSESLNKSTVETTKQDSNLLVSLLGAFKFAVQKVASPSWSFFERTNLETVFRACELDAETRLIDIKQLHRVLVDELTDVQGNTIVQRQFILAEIRKILLHAQSINVARKTNLGILAFVDAWRQVVSVLVLHLPYEILSAKDQQTLQIYVMERLLKKVNQEDLSENIADLLSGVVLLILLNMQRCHVKECKETNIARSGVTSSAAAVATKSVLRMNTNSLKSVLTQLIHWVQVSDVSTQSLRSNLYAALLLFLQLFDDPHPTGATHVGALDGPATASGGSQYGRNGANQYAMNLSTDLLGAFNEKLVEMLCHDCTSGQSLVEMLAMAILSRLTCLSGNVHWIAQISARGYLKCMVEAVLGADNTLREALQPEPSEHVLRELFVYESKMKLLVRVATTSLGAELLLEQRLLACLSNMKVFDFHPTIGKHWAPPSASLGSLGAGTTASIARVDQRYMIMWLPCMHLCNALLTALGTENKSVVTQVMHFLLSHLDAVEQVLRAGATGTGGVHLSEDSLLELSLVTGVIARCANNDLAQLLDSSSSSYGQHNSGVLHDHRAHLYRVQKLMFALLPRFVLTEANVRDLLCDRPVSIGGDSAAKPTNASANATTTSPPTAGIISFQTSVRLHHFMQISCNALMYARNVVANHGIEHGGVAVIFQPTLCDYSSLLPSRNSAASIAMAAQTNRAHCERTPPLGVVVDTLIAAVAFHHRERVTFDFLDAKHADVPKMASLEIREFLVRTTASGLFGSNRFVDPAADDESAVVSGDGMGVGSGADLMAMRESVRDLLAARLTLKQRQMEHARFVIENCAYLIWSHLDYYMLKAIPKARNAGLLDMNVAYNLDATLASNSEVTWKVSSEDLSVLKQGLVQIFNDSFSKQLIETATGQIDADRNILETLVRRIKRLIQFVPVN